MQGRDALCRTGGQLQHQCTANAPRVEKQGDCNCLHTSLQPIMQSQAPRHTCCRSTSHWLPLRLCRLLYAKPLPWLPPPPPAGQGAAAAAAAATNAAGDAASDSQSLPEGVQPDQVLPLLPLVATPARAHRQLATAPSAPPCALRAADRAVRSMCCGSRRVGQRPEAEGGERCREAGGQPPHERTQCALSVDTIVGTVHGPGFAFLEHGSTGWPDALKRPCPDLRLNCDRL